MNIEIPEGYEVDKKNSTFDIIKLKKIEAKLPKTWEELKRVKGYYSFILSFSTDSDRSLYAFFRSLRTLSKISSSLLLDIDPDRYG